MTTIRNNHARVLGRAELLTMFNAQIRPKAKRDRFERLRDQALTKADHVIDCRFSVVR